MTNQALADEKHPDVEKHPHGAIPIDEKHLAARIKEVMGDDSQVGFARRCGVSPTALRKYLEGAEPSVNRLVSMAEAGGVTVEWLATGRQPKLRRDLVDALQAQAARAEPVQALDRDRLAQAVRVVEESLQAAELPLPPDKRAELFCAAYDLIGQMGATAQARALLAQFVKLAR